MKPSEKLIRLASDWDRKPSLVGLVLLPFLLPSVAPVSAAERAVKEVRRAVGIAAEAVTPMATDVITPEGEKGDAIRVILNKSVNQITAEDLKLLARAYVKSAAEQAALVAQMTRAIAAELIAIPTSVLEIPGQVVTLQQSLVAMTKDILASRASLNVILVNSLTTDPGARTVLSKPLGDVTKADIGFLVDRFLGNKK